MDSPFARCREEDDYQKRLAALLAEVRRSPEVPSVVAGDLLALPEDLGRLFLVSNRAYWSREFYFEARVPGRQNLLAWWQNVEMFSMRALEQLQCYCNFPDRWRQYEAPILLFVATPLVLSYYSGLTLQGSADDQTRIWTIALTEYVFMAGTTFVFNARDGACPSYYTYNHRFDHVGGSLLFWLPVKILNALP